MRLRKKFTACGVRELPDQEGEAWTHVVSIWDKAFLENMECRERVKAIAPGAALLFCFFEDVDNPHIPNAPPPSRRETHPRLYGEDSLHSEGASPLPRRDFPLDRHCLRYSLPARLSWSGNGESAAHPDPAALGLAESADHRTRR